MPKTRLQVEFFRAINICKGMIGTCFLNGFHLKDGPGYIFYIPHRDITLFGANILIEFTTSSYPFFKKTRDGMFNLCLLQKSIPIRQARLASQIVKHFPMLRIKILEAMKDKDPDAENDLLMTAELYNPKISFNEADKGDAWTFYVERRDTGFFYSVEFEKFNVVDSQHSC